MRGLVREGVGSHFIDAPGSKSGAGRRVVLAPTFNAPGVTPEVRIYKRKQESEKKERKHALDQETIKKKENFTFKSDQLFFRIRGF